MISNAAAARHGRPAAQADLRQDELMDRHASGQSHYAAEIVDGDVSGGTNTSHTIVFEALQVLLDSVGAGPPEDAYERAVVDDNVLGKDKEGGRRRTFRYLRELYVLTPDSLLFRALRDLWVEDESARPLLAGQCALARDSVFRASSAAILGSAPGSELTSGDFAAAVEKRFPSSYRESTLMKIGRNTFSSWEQTGHLEAVKPSVKIRRRPVCGPANVAYALLLGHVGEARGQALFETPWAEVLDQPASHLRDLAFAASQQGLIDLRDAGGVVQVDFSALLRPFEGELL